MVQTVKSLNAALDTLAAIEPAFAVALQRAGYPPPRVRDRGYATLLRTIMGQQVSVAAAQSIWNKLEAQIGDLTDPATVAAASDEQLRAAGLSRQKVSYARSLAE
jgi:DNA-3-methyladenine glycosylase II